VQIPKGSSNFFGGCPGHSKALAIFAAAVVAASLRRLLQKDHSIANNAIQQK